MSTIGQYEWPEEAIPTEDINPTYADWRDGHGKSIGILRSTSATLSLVSSSFLIWMILRSTKRLTTTQHRILLGMSVSDVIFSISMVHFNALAPRELGYIVWNARGSQASCAADGFVYWMGICSSLSYNCSLNLYYLAVIKYNKTDRYIKAKIEPFLHGVPITLALIFSVSFLVNGNINSTMDGDCSWPTYDPPHCIGYEDGEVREGFNIECGRGHNDEALTFWYAGFYVYYFGVPIIIVATLGMMYKSVLNRERRMERYGAGALHPRGSDGEFNSNSLGGIRDALRSIYRFVRVTCRRWFSSSSDREHSRRILHQAIAYSTAYFLTWMWCITYVILVTAGVAAPLWLSYMLNIAYPLQGFFNMLVFIYPKVVCAKRSQGWELSWCQAIGKVIFPGREWGRKRSSAPTTETRTNGSVQNKQNLQGPCVAKEHVSNGAKDEKAEIWPPNEVDKDFLKN